MGTCDWRGNVDCSCIDNCYGAPPEGSWDAADNSNARDPPGPGDDNDNDSDGNDSNGWDWDSNEDSSPGIPDYPEPDQQRPPPGGVEPPVTIEPPVTNWPGTRPPRPGPPEPDCVDCRPGEIG